MKEANRQWVAQALGGGVAWFLSGAVLLCGPASSASLTATPGDPAQCDSQTASQAPAMGTTDIPQDLVELIDQLMLDLPSYVNRVIQRASRMGDETPLYLLTAGRAEMASVSPEAWAAKPSQSQLPELMLNQRSSQSPDRGRAASEEIYQVFFTTLERQYLRPELRSPELRSPSASISSQSAPEPTITQALDRIAPANQQFHWLILARRQDAKVSDDFAMEPAAAQSTASPWRIISLRSKLAPYPAADRLLSPVRNSQKGPVGQGIALWLRDWHSGAIDLSDSDMGSGLGCEFNTEFGTGFSSTPESQN